MVQNLLANTGDIKRPGFDPWVEEIPKGEHDNPLQYSCLENPMDRGAWQAAVHSIAQSWTQLKQPSMHVISNTEKNRILKEYFLGTRMCEFNEIHFSKRQRNTKTHHPVSTFLHPVPL